MATKIREFDINGNTAEIETSQPCEYINGTGGTFSYAIEPNKLYVFQDAISTLDLYLDSPAETDIVNEYHFIMQTDTTATINWPQEVVGFAGGSAPTLNDNTYYEVSILEGLATVTEY